MKKNKMLRTASVLLIMVMLTTGIVGGTFAKYTTTGTGSDTARVARWGVEFAATTDLFATAYKDTAVNDNTATVKVTATGDTSKLVAPGTTGTGLGIQSYGSEPEVSYSVKIQLDNASKVPTLKYTPSSTGSTAIVYNPIKFYVFNGDTQISNALTLDQLKGLFNGSNIIYTYEVSTQKYYFDGNLSGNVESDEEVPNEPAIKIKWEWEFEDATSAPLFNELDTILGNTAAGQASINTYSGGNISDIQTVVDLQWTMTATQID